MLVGGPSGSVSVISPLGEQVIPTTVYNTDVQKLWKVDIPYPGVYSVTVRTKGKEL